MFFLSKRARRDPRMDFLPEQPIRLDESRLDAWAFAPGQRRGEDRPTFRPHRGQLPDVDFSRAVQAPRRKGLISRLFSREEPAGTAETQPGAEIEDHGALGESRRKAYVRLIETEASGKAAPRAQARTAKQSRAA